ncbi:MAG: CheD [Rhodocyclaceae bacterium]|nr:CheD [Rhodocyclaceae bacterium]
MVDYASLPVREIERLARVIHPGEWVVESARPIATLLGSCVAVCLFDGVLRVAGMNHFMLPTMSRGSHSDDDMLLAGDACMTSLLNALLARGADRRRIQAKAFGGGTVVDAVPPAFAIGKRNADFTREWLERERIPLVASDFLGPWSRKVVLIPDTGDAWCKRMASSLVDAKTVEREEKAYADALRQQPEASGKKIELF